MQAILATAGVFLVMLVLYGLRILRATPRFVKGVIARHVRHHVPVPGRIHLQPVRIRLQLPATPPSPLGIGISVVICIVAAMNLILDFDFIEKGVQNKLPAYMDWYAGFGLVVTLVWLYLEMLRLLAKIRN